MRWRSSWRRGELLFALLLLVVAAGIIGLAALAIELFGR
jgi:hypothetical protein